MHDKVPVVSAAVTAKKKHYQISKLAKYLYQRLIASSPRQHYITCEIVEISILQKTQEYVNALYSSGKFENKRG